MTPSRAPRGNLGGQTHGSAPPNSSAADAKWYHQHMRKQAWLFLLAGFAVGFAVLFLWTRQRAPEIVRAMPVAVDGRIPSAPQSPVVPPPPPLDTARVQQLETTIKGNPNDFEAIVELANINFD